ncbi:hypothetical protein U9M48_037262 [Paspalum notatum var. saurae]|uniref:Phytocyanin domain-containing protein n=1 Tax=Paspalum notatum var. saurae TaxID=547442 RepID=A0AAQ3UKT6_PASNO
MGKRGSCSALLLVLALGFTLLVCSAAETYVVGDSKGWGFSVSYDSWSAGKTFAVGDTLVFNSPAGVHNVVAVNASEYRSCKASTTAAADAAPSTAAAADATAISTTRFELKRGVNYFISDVPGHCAAGMKLRVVAN